MFTSRAEHRLYLREDNADLRLTERGRELGLVDDRSLGGVQSQARTPSPREAERLKATWVYPAVVALGPGDTDDRQADRARVTAWLI